MLNFNIFFFFWGGGGCQKNAYFWGMMKLLIFLGSSQNWTIFYVIYIHFRFFS